MPFHGAGNKHQGSGYRIQNPVDHGNQIVLANIYFDDQIKLFFIALGKPQKRSFFSGPATKKGELRAWSLRKNTFFEVEKKNP